MKRRTDDPRKDDAEVRKRLIGLGRDSMSKSYYPELKSQLEALERFRLLLDQVSDAIFVVDAETGLIRDVSGAADVMLGCNADRLVGLPLRDLLPDHIARYCQNILNSETDSIKMETELRPPAENGDAAPAVVPVEMSLRIVLQDGARMAVIVARDVSERKRNEEALRKSHDELEIRVRERTRELDRANRAKSEFLSIVSHELRTPLTSIIGFAMISRKRLEEAVFPRVTGDEAAQREMRRVSKNIDIIVSEGERLTTLINDVLDLAKLEAHRVEYRMKPVSPEAFILRALEVAAPLFEESDLELKVDVPQGLPTVTGDMDRLIQVMVNLLSNAAKFTERGRVVCSASQVGGHLRVSVADTGVGVPPELRTAVFEKFTQAETSLADRPKGTGLGLPICRHIVEEGHRGLIWVEDGPTGGSDFVFTIPAFGR